MRKVLISLVIFLVLLVGPSGLRYVQFYVVGGGDVEPPPAYEPKTIADVSVVPTPTSHMFVDTPVVGDGSVLLDMAHANSFTVEEISYLDGRLTARGFEMIPYTGGDLATMLRGVNALITIAPIDAYEPDEVQAVRDFVDRGGRLLMVGDPTRFLVTVEETDFSFTTSLEKDDIPLNTLANEFNIAFNGDYLYNTVENEGNFRNIILKESAFAEDKLTDGLTEVAFYSAHSLQVGAEGKALLTADDNTWSSATDRPGGLVLAASSENGRVLALGDIHFMLEPYYTVFDNSRFIAQIADFLTETNDRGFVLADFPYFYHKPVDLVYTGAPDLGPGAFDEIIALQDAFRQVDHDLQLAATPNAAHDTLFLGLYNQADEVVDILASEGISLTIDPPILTADETAVSLDAAEADETAETTDDETAVSETITETVRLIQSGWGHVQMSGTALVLLHEKDGQRSVVVLAASNEGLANTVDRLLDLIPLDADYALSDCLMQDNLALCPTTVANEKVEAELLSGEAAAENPRQTDEGAEEPDENDNTDVGAISQGVIGLGDSVSGALAEGESHAWTFSDGPAVVDILLESDDLDGILELYDPDDVLITSADEGLSGDSELLSAIDIEDDGTYTIVVRDFWDGAGDYTLSVTAVDTTTHTSSSGNRIFIFGDDNGSALNDGFTSVDFFAAHLADDYDVTVWVSSLDGSLEPDLLDDVNLLIWDSGDYRDVEGFLDPDTEVILNYLDTDTANVLIVGSSPALLSYLDTSPLADLEVTGDDPTLLNGLTAGDIIELNQTYEAIVPDFQEGDAGENDSIFLLRGAASDSPGSVAGVVTGDALGNGQKSALVLFPFTALPESEQEQIFANLMDWFALN